MPKAATITAAPSSSRGRYSGFDPVPITLSIAGHGPLITSTSTSKSLNKGKGKSSASSSSTTPPTHYLWIREHKTKAVQAAEAAAAAAANGKGKGKNPALIKPTLASTSSAPSAEDDLPAGRTLFIANLPVDFDEEDLRTVFKEYGAIERVLIKVSTVGREGVEGWRDESDDEEEDEDSEDNEDGEDHADADNAAEHDMEVDQTDAMTSATTGTARRRRQRRKTAKDGPSAPEIIPLPSLIPRSRPFLAPSSSAYIIYLSELSLTRAISLSPSRPAVNITHAASTTGLEYFKKLHESSRPDIDLLRQHADSSLALFDHHTAKQKLKTSSGPIVDDDGFTLVVRGGKYGRTAGRGESGVGVATRRFEMDSKRAVAKLGLGLGAGGDGDGEGGMDIDAREGLERGKKRKRKMELDGFYRFQRNEQKRQGQFSINYLRLFRAGWLIVGV